MSDKTNTSTSSMLKQKDKIKNEIKSLQEKIASDEMKLKMLNLELDNINLKINNEKLSKDNVKLEQSAIDANKSNKEMIKRVLVAQKEVKDIKTDFNKNLKKEIKETLKDITLDIKDKIGGAYVYLFELGPTIDLYTSFNVPKDKISSNHFIFKFGRSDNLKSREADHKRDYERFSNVKVKLCHSKECSNKCVSDNEAKIKKWFKDNTYTFVKEVSSEEIKSKKCNELVIIEKKDLKSVKEMYDKL